MTADLFVLGLAGLFPFGRMARSIVRTYENPTRVSEELTGVPLLALQR